MDMFSRYTYFNVKSMHTTVYMRWVQEEAHEVFTEIIGIELAIARELTTSSSREIAAARFWVVGNL